MIELIELPVLLGQFEWQRELFSKNEAQLKQSSLGIQYMDYRLNEKQHVYFYLLTENPEDDQYYLWDRIIPKAPVCLILEVELDELSGNLLKAFKSRYDTPLLSVQPGEKCEIKGKTLYFVPGEKDCLKKLIRSIFEWFLENKPKETP